MCRDVRARTLALIDDLAVLLRLQGNVAEAEPLLSESLEHARNWFAADDPEFASALARLGAAQLEQREFVEAEPLLRGCLAIRAAKGPGAWSHCNTMSMLGASLAGHGKHDEADPLLVEGYEKMVPPPEQADRKRHALEWSIEHYQAWGKPDEAARFRKLLEAGSAPPSQGKGRSVRVECACERRPFGNPRAERGRESTTIPLRAIAWAAPRPWTSSIRAAVRSVLLR